MIILYWMEWLEGVKSQPMFSLEIAPKMNHSLLPKMPAFDSIHQLRSADWSRYSPQITSIIIFKLTFKNRCQICMGQQHVNENCRSSLDRWLQFWLLFSTLTVGNIYLWCVFFLPTHQNAQVQWIVIINFFPSSYMPRSCYGTFFFSLCRREVCVDWTHFLHSLCAFKRFALLLVRNRNIQIRYTICN